MKNLFRRFFLKRKLRRIAAELEAVQHERENLKLIEDHLLVQSNRARLELLNFDIEARRA